jgi:hypothetical protein
MEHNTIITSLAGEPIIYQDAIGSYCAVLARTLVGSGLKDKYALRKPLAELVPPHITLHPEHVATFSPESNSVTTASGKTVQYEALVVAAGLKINWDGIANLPQALAHPQSGVSSIYSFDTADKTWADIEVRCHFDKYHLYWIFDAHLSRL